MMVTAPPEPSRGRRGTYSAASRLASSLGVLLMAAGLWQGGVSPDPPGPPPTPFQSSPPADEPTGPVLARAEPVGLTIPAIGVETADLAPLDIDSTGVLEAPQDTNTVGWYEAGPWPGQAGPAVMGAHVDSANGPAVFFRLRELSPGDEVVIARGDGTEAVFSVYGVKRYDKDAFPTRRVYGSTGNRAELRLITCDGEFERNNRSYTGNVVVYAILESPRG